MSASGFNIGWGGVTVHYGSTTIALGNVKDVEVDRSGTVKDYFGDGGIFSKIIAIREKKRTLKISGASIVLLQSIPEDTPCTVTAINLDAVNGVGAGAITITLANAVCVSNPYKGQSTEFTMGDVTFQAASSDGTTDPLTYAVA